MTWYNRERLWYGLPWTFTEYGMDGGRLFVEAGFPNTKEEKVQLYCILNISLSKNLVQRAFGLGTVHADSMNLDLKRSKVTNIRHNDHVKELLSGKVEKERMCNRASARECMHSSEDEDITDADDDHQDYDEDDGGEH